MPKDDYIFVHQRITKALAPELSDDEAAEAAEEDWIDDLAGGAKMTFDKYASGLFGIADLWTETIEELDYVVFLNKLFRRITYIAPPAESEQSKGEASPRGEGGAKPKGGKKPIKSAGSAVIAGARLGSKGPDAAAKKKKPEAGGKIGEQAKPGAKGPGPKGRASRPDTRSPELLLWEEASAPSPPRIPSPPDRPASGSRSRRQSFNDATSKRPRSRTSADTDVMAATASGEAIEGVDDGAQPQEM
eukprot:7230635-Prymnesium_polylepis.1